MFRFDIYFEFLLFFKQKIAINFLELTKMGNNDSKIKSNKYKRQDKTCLTKLVKKSLNSIVNKKNSNHSNFKNFHDLKFLKSQSTSSNDLSSNASQYQAYHKLINKDYIDDLSHDSIASSFVFTSAAGLRNVTTVRQSPSVTRRFYDIELPQHPSRHVRVYHDIYFF